MDSLKPVNVPPQTVTGKPEITKQPAPGKAAPDTTKDSVSLSDDQDANPENEIKQLKQQLAQVKKASVTSYVLGVAGALAMTVGGAIIMPGNLPLGLTITTAGVAAVFKATHILQNNVISA